MKINRSPGRVCVRTRQEDVVIATNSQAANSLARRAALRLILALGIDQISQALARGLYIAGGIFLLLKLLGLHRLVGGVHLGVFVVLSLLPCGVVLLRRAYSSREAAAWLDLCNRAGGRILGNRQVESDGLVLPRLTLLPLIRHNLLPALFVLAVGLVPGALPASSSSPRALLKQIERIERKIEVVKEKRVLSPLETTQMLLQAEELKANAQRMPEVAAEGSATLQAVLDRKILKRAEDQLAAMKAASATSRADGSLGAEENKALVEALKALARNMGGMEELPEELRKALAESLNGAPLEGLDASALAKMDAAALKKLVEALKASCQSGMSKAGECRGLLSSDAARALEGMLAKLSELELEGAACSALLPGAGGVTRGRGDAPLRLGDESDPEGIWFKPLERKPGETMLPGAKLSTTRIRPGKIAPEEFRLPERTGEQWKGALTQVGTTELSPARRNAAAAYFKQLSIKEEKEEDSHDQ